MVSNKNGWISSYEIQFGMAPTRNVRGIVTSAVCNFCKSFGPETKVPSPTPVTGMSTILTNESRTRKRHKLKTIKPLKSMRTDRFKEYFQPISTDVIPQNTTIAKADRGATKHYFQKADKSCFKNLISLSSTGSTVHLPNLETITSSASGLLPLHTLVSPAAKLTHIFDDLHRTSLLSLGQLCDDSCKVLLDQKHMHVYKNNSIVLKGYCNIIINDILFY